MNATGYSINVMHIRMTGSNDRDKKKEKRQVILKCFCTGS